MDEFVSVENQEVAEPETQSVENQEVADLEPTDNEGETAEHEDVQEDFNQDNNTEEGRENNSVIAEMRRQQEAERAELQAQLEQERAEKEALQQRQTLYNTAKEMGLSDEEFEELWEEQEAENAILREKEEADARAEQAERDREQIENELLDLKAQAVVDEDVRYFQEKNPKIKSVDDLPKDYFSLMATGQMSRDEAYQTALNRQKKSERVPPDEIGQVGSPDTPKDYFTRDEVERMSQEEVSKNLDIINKSQPKWK